MRNLAAALILIGLAATSADAQGRGRNARGQGIPPGQMPPAGMCRVWYDNVPPGRQPRPTSCNEAERVAARSNNARVIYGDNAYGGYNDRYGGYNNDRYGNGTYDRDYPYGDDRVENRGRNRTWSEAVRDRIEGARRGGTGYNSVPFDNGYRDGLDKGREDARDRDSFDPVRHSWYRSGNRGYNDRYGTRDQYKLAYRDGFEAGYRDGYRTSRR